MDTWAPLLSLSGTYFILASAVTILHKLPLGLEPLCSGVIEQDLPGLAHSSWLLLLRSWDIPTGAAQECGKVHALGPPS